MKQKIFAVVIGLLLLAALCLPAYADSVPASHIYDISNLLTDREWESLDTLAAELSQRHGCGVYIVTVADYTQYGNGTVLEVTSQIYNDPENRFGIGADRDGILLLLSMSARDWALFVHGNAAQYAFNNYVQAQLENSFLPNFQENDWYGGFAGYLHACDNYLTLAEEGHPEQESPAAGIVMSVSISCIISLIVCLILKGKMKSVRPRKEARDYVTDGLQLTQHHDRYTHTTQIRRRIETKSPSQSTRTGGGSGRSGKF